MRPLQWAKNGLVFAAPLFAHRLFEGGTLARSVAAAIVFCAVSSGIYLINDVRDAAEDRLHPRKRHRPIAAGAVSERHARIVAAALLAGGAAAAVALRPLFGGVILAYIGLMLLYAHGLKRLVILDVFAIAAGFVLRAAGGAVAIDVPFSPWLYVCTMLLALFLGFGKRRHELTSLLGDAGKHRANLDSYTVPFLDQLIGLTGAATVVAYALYTFDAPNAPSNQAMMLTIPFVVYALFRYLYLIHCRGLGGAPEELLVADAPLLAGIAGWGLVTVVILYLGQ